MFSISSSSSLDNSIPALDIGFRPLYSGGLCDAVIIIPPANFEFLTVNCKQGVGINPTSYTSKPK